VCYDYGYDGVAIGIGTITGVFAESGGAMVSEIADNFYKSDGTTMMEFPSHCTYGWKAVAAKAPWPGRPGFINSGCCDGVGTGVTKYKTITSYERSYAKVTLDQTSSCPGDEPVLNIVEEYEHIITQTATVDDYGNVTRSGSVLVSYVVTSNIADTITVSSCKMADATGNPATSAAGNAIPHSADYAQAMAPLGGVPLDAECGIIEFGFGTPSNPLDVISGVGTASELNSLTTAEKRAKRWGANTTFTITDTEVTVNWSGTDSGHSSAACGGGSGSDLVADSTIEVAYEKKITLSGEYPYSMVLTESENLLGEYPITDDTIYPWRTDSSTWLVPMVSRDAASVVPTFGEWNDEYCSVGDTILYSGEIRGIPLPAGYGYHFNHYHRTYCAYSDTVCNACSVGIGEMGAAPLPMSATQWTDKVDGADMRGRGAHIIQYGGGQYGSASPGPIDGVIVQKWAETLVKWPSINFARPAGRDRYLVDETAVVCGSLSGYDLTLDDPATLTGKIAIADGVYQITGGSGTAYTVGDRIYDNLIAFDGVAQLRFPSARSIISKLNVTAVQTSPGLVTVTASGKHWLKRGGTEFDTVTFTGIGGLTTATASVTSDTEFTVSGTLVTSPSTGTISDGGESLAAYDTTCSKNTFLARVWKSDFSTPGDPWSVTETEVTLSPIARHPTVLYSSPNDTFPHGYSIPWGTITPDMCYGAQWSARFDQVIFDPFWQPNHVPCGHSGSWEQDDIPCHTPDGDHYAFPPLVEARATTPSGAPTLPVTFFTASSEGIPGALGHTNCNIEPYTQGHSMSWYPSWLTCTDWQELIAYKC
jgi:hypothetical protein